MTKDRKCPPIGCLALFTFPVQSELTHVVISCFHPSQPSFQQLQTCHNKRSTRHTLSARCEDADAKHPISWWRPAKSIIITGKRSVSTCERRTNSHNCIIIIIYHAIKGLFACVVLVVPSLSLYTPTCLRSIIHCVVVAKLFSFSPRHHHHHHAANSAIFSTLPKNFLLSDLKDSCHHQCKESG